ncbi:MAG: GNAT family N-acetyltransferase [Candidatus Hadarchaeum sp.]
MLTIRPIEERDREAVVAIAEEVGVFTKEEVVCVEELLQVYLYKAGQQDYTFVGAYDDAGSLLGFVCFGPTPLTEGTYDIYWVAVRKSAQGQGVGRTLLDWTEGHLRAAGARLLILETSSTPEYKPAREFYKHLGYTGRTCVPDFYSPGDDLVVFYKALR